MSDIPVLYVRLDDAECYFDNWREAADWIQDYLEAWWPFPDGVALNWEIRGETMDARKFALLPEFEG